ncbi:unnamed protein product [Caenorhabditis brenneri]
MKLSGYSAALFVIVVTLIVPVQSEDKKYDLTDKNQFSFFFKEQWQTMFNTPQPIANPAKDQIVSLLDKQLHFQPCYAVERTSGHDYFVGRLWGMMHALEHCEVTSSIVLPVDPTINKDAALMEMEFHQKASYNSYTRHFHEITMELKARKAAVNEPYHIYKITEVCAPI